MIQLTKENLYLVEWLEDSDSKTIVYLPDKDSTSKTIKKQGLKVSHIYNSDGKLVTYYNYKEGRTDLSFFVNEKEFYFVSVMKDKYGNFHWMKFLMTGIRESENSKIQALQVLKTERADETESILLNRMFPKFFDAVKNFNSPEE
jgi:hypothetical protein